MKYIFLFISLLLVRTSFAQFEFNDKDNLRKYNFSYFYNAAVDSFKIGSYLRAKRILEGAMYLKDLSEEQKHNLNKLYAKVCFLNNLKTELNDLYSLEDYWDSYLTLKLILRLNPTDKQAKKIKEILLDKLSAETNMVYIHGGSYQMGINGGLQREGPKHLIKLSSFYMDKHEVTNYEYAIFLNYMLKSPAYVQRWIKLGKKGTKIKYKNGYYIVDPGFEQFPVVNVTWYGAQSYCKWLGMDLPTEAQWEYAASLGIRGKKLSDIAVYRQNSGLHLHKIESKQPDSLGIYDLLGNAREWCRDYYWKNYYILSPSNNPVAISDNDKHSVRGGAYTTYSENMYIQHRDVELSRSGVSNLGFRCVCEKKPIFR